MKYSIGSVKPVAVKPFDFAAATEALTDTYVRLGDAYEQVIAAEGRIVEAEMAMDTCKSALASIEKFGVTATTMAVFNGENELDAALSLEALDLESIESLGATVKKVRKENYISGLEGMVSDGWKKFVAMLQKMWEAIKRWFKELFDRNAKYARIVKEAMDKKVFVKFTTTGKDKKFKLLSKDQMNAALAAIDELMKAANSVNFQSLAPTAPSADVLGKAGLKVDENGKVVKADNFGTVFEKKEDTLDKLIGSNADIEMLGKKFVEVTAGGGIKNAAKNVEKMYSTLIKGAQDAKDDAGKQAEVTRKKQELPKVQSYVTAYNTLVGLVGNCLVTIANYASK